MHLLAPLLALLGIEVEAITERVRTMIIVNTVIVGLALVGLGFLLAAGFIALADLLGPLYAALLFAAAFLLLALAVFAGTRIGESRRRRHIAERRRSSESGAFVTTAALTALPVVLKSPLLRAIAVPAAVVAALVLARRSDQKPDD